MKPFIWLLVGLFTLPAVPAIAVTQAQVVRVSASQVAISWRDPGAVTVFAATDPAQGVASAKRIASGLRSGRITTSSDAATRRYFLLRGRDGRVVRVAERVIPLDQGSNFRDLGGYAGAGGKAVRWGAIYRSGATPLLTDSDRRTIAGLGLRDLIDLRSSEERMLAPTRINGVRYAAIGYSMRDLMRSAPGTVGPMTDIYTRFPEFLAPQLRLVFAKLLAGDGPVVYNCSAGQDRTGFVTAMILSALGTPRLVIEQDYLLSTQYRHPEYEMPPIDAATAARDPTAAMFAAFAKNPAYARPRPLMSVDGKPFLATAFAQIERRWGSVDRYLAAEIGLTAADVAQLRARFLE